MKIGMRITRVDDALIEQNTPRQIIIFETSLSIKPQNKMGGGGRRKL